MAKQLSISIAGFAHEHMWPCPYPEKELPLNPNDVGIVIYELEAQFHISIPYEDWQRLRTAGDIYEYLLGRMAKGKNLNDPSGRCRTAMLFYRLRRAIMHACDHSKQEIRPESGLKFLVPKKDREKIWQMIGRHSDLRLPLLELPNWLEFTAILGVGVVCATVLIQTVSADWRRQNPMFLAKLIGAIFLGAVTVVALISLPLYVLLTESFAQYFPRKLRTMRQLVMSVASLNEGLLAAEAGKDIWPVVQRIISEEMGIKPKHIKKESRLYEDLKTH